MTSWPTMVQVTARLQSEAGAHAARLGHALTTWSAVAGRASAARCTHCGDLARITVRAVGKATIQGPATQLRCTGHKREKDGSNV